MKGDRVALSADALMYLSEAICALTTWVSDHTPGADHSSLCDVGEFLQRADNCIDGMRRLE
jgi:hypothetical protein